MVVSELLKEPEDEKAEEKNTAFPEHFEYEVYKEDKFIFRIPKEVFTSMKTLLGLCIRKYSKGRSL